MDVSFVKMHGLANDFVVVDARDEYLDFSPEEIRLLSHKKTGIGFDQFITISAPKNAQNDVWVRAYNGGDGGEVICGNAARCVAKLVMEKLNRKSIKMETLASVWEARRAEKDHVAINMGSPYLNWQNIPLASKQDTNHLNITHGELSDPAAVGMGNPHLVFFVDDVEAIDLEKIGSKLEYHPSFPAQTNVEIVQVLSENHIRIRVWERVTGITEACETGACAAAVAAARRGLTGREMIVSMGGGDLLIEWKNDDSVWMTGSAETIFTGQFELDNFGS